MIGIHLVFKRGANGSFVGSDGLNISWKSEGLMSSGAADALWLQTRPAGCDYWPLRCGFRPH